MGLDLTTIMSAITLVTLPFSRTGWQTYIERSQSLPQRIASSGRPVQYGSDIRVSRRNFRSPSLRRYLPRAIVLCAKDAAGSRRAGDHPFTAPCGTGAEIHYFTNRWSSRSIWSGRSTRHAINLTPSDSSGDNVGVMSRSAAPRNGVRYTIAAIAAASVNFDLLAFDALQLPKALYAVTNAQATVWLRRDAGH